MKLPAWLRWKTRRPENASSQAVIKPTTFLNHSLVLPHTPDEKPPPYILDASFGLQALEVRGTDPSCPIAIASAVCHAAVAAQAKKRTSEAAAMAAAAAVAAVIDKTGNAVAAVPEAEVLTAATAIAAGIAHIAGNCVAYGPEAATMYPIINFRPLATDPRPNKSSYVVQRAIFDSISDICYAVSCAVPESAPKVAAKISSAVLHAVNEAATTPASTRLTVAASNGSFAGRIVQDAVPIILRAIAARPKDSRQALARKYISLVEGTLEDGARMFRVGVAAGASVGVSAGASAGAAP